MNDVISSTCGSHTHTLTSAAHIQVSDNLQFAQLRIEDALNVLAELVSISLRLQARGYEIHTSDGENIIPVGKYIRARVNEVLGEVEDREDDDRDLVSEAKRLFLEVRQHEADEDAARLSRAVKFVANSLGDTAEDALRIRDCETALDCVDRIYALVSPWLNADQGGVS